MSSFQNVLYFVLGAVAGIVLGVFLFNAVFTYFRDQKRHDARHLGTALVLLALTAAVLVFFALVLHSWLSVVLGLIIGFAPYVHVSNSETEKQKAAAFKANDKWNAQAEEDRKAKEEAKRRKALEKRMEKDSR